VPWPRVLSARTARVVKVDSVPLVLPLVLVHLDQLARPTAADLETNINLISNTTNRGGLVVRARCRARKMRALRTPSGISDSLTMGSTLFTVSMRPIAKNRPTDRESRAAPLAALL
jgi:hypothetical protein